MAYAFALGHFGFPQMGVAGLGLSYVINNIVLLIFYIYFLLNKKMIYLIVKGKMDVNN